MADKPSKPQEGQQQKPTEIQPDPRLAHTEQKDYKPKVEKR